MKQFSDQDLIDPLHTLRDRVGRTPMEYETYDYSHVPRHTVYCKRSGYWREALKAAGIPLDPKNMGYNRETLLTELRDIVKQLGRAPSLREVRKMGGPGATTVACHFGSSTAALREHGLEPRREAGRFYDREYLLEALRGAARELGRAP